MRPLTLIALSCLALFTAACGTDDIPQAHKGRMFDRTGALNFYAGGDGLTGPVIGPGTYRTGIYDELRLVDCSQETEKEALTALTKDGVQFKLDIYVTYSANCEDAVVTKLLEKLSPAKGNTITRDQLYATYIRPAIGEAVREKVSPHNANDINNKREEILSGIRERFQELIKDDEVVRVTETTLSNLDYPDEMDHANTDRAVQAVLKDKAVAERERVDAETLTAESKQKLAEAEGKVEAARIDQIGAALRRNPEYLQYDMQVKMPQIYEKAGAGGNMIIAAPSPQVIVQPKTK